MQLALIGMCAILLDRFVPKPFSWQLGFRRLAQGMEFLLYGPSRIDARLRLPLGSVATLLLVLPFALLAWGLSSIPYVEVVLDIALLYLALEINSLTADANGVARALQQQNLQQAQEQLNRMVSCDTNTMDEEQISLTVVETTLNKACETVFATLFWFLLAGATGVVIHSLVNALDKLWGYPTPRYYYFGWFTAFLRAMLNWIPAQLAALSYVILGNRNNAWRCWRTQVVAAGFSTNAALAAGAGALGLQLGGAMPFFGRLVPRPALGEGLLPRVEDIHRALTLVYRTLGLWAALLVFAGVIWSLWMGVELTFSFPPFTGIGFTDISLSDFI